MTTTNLSQHVLSGFLESLADVLDIPDDLYAEADAKYRDLGQWLEDEDADLNRRPPEIYPQGSFRLGTMIRPMGNADEYDIDLVYKRDLQKESTTQAQLKQEAGENLSKYVDEKAEQGADNPQLSEKRRCWTLKYPDRFHMDVLPAIPDADGRANNILITDRELARWQPSNPIDYAEWFKSRMVTRFLETRAAMACALKASVEEIPEWKVKTPLQRAVQIMKRHRDLRFEYDLDDKPASIIISTLAAHAYDNEVDLLEAMNKLVRDMPNHIDKRNGVYWIPNPVNLDENFADRWVDQPQRAEKFFLWLKALESDLLSASEQHSMTAVGERMEACVGEGVVNEALEHASAIVKTGTGRGADVPVLSDHRHCQNPPWTVRSLKMAKVRGSVRKAEGQSKELWPLSNRPVPSDLWLRFQLTTNVQKPYEVHWQVVNTGNEAATDNGLRGGFYEGGADDGCIHWESTKYAGTHWVEAFVIKDDICVARSGRTYVRIR